MYEIKKPSTDTRLSSTLSVYDWDDGTTEFKVMTIGYGVTAIAEIKIGASELSELIDFLTHVYNRHVDNGIVDTDKYQL